MKKSKIARCLSIILAVAMVVGGIPLNVKAAYPESMAIVSDKQSVLAPGVTQSEIVAYDANGARVEYFVATADLSVDTVSVHANYKDNQNEVLGMSKTTEQVAAAEAKHEEPYSVVAAMNASYYNMTTGKPTGVFVMEGNDITTESEGNSKPFFAILNDGTAMIGQTKEYSNYKGKIAEAIGGWTMLVWNGEIVSGTDTKTKYPRSTIGVTAEGNVVFMNANGNQAPKSIGLTKYEQAEIMKSLGCVAAIELDGGGSATYGCKPEGEDTFRVISSPADGSERSVSNSIMIVSTAAPDGTFARASLSAENDYVTPDSVVNISATGVDAAGGTAEIPEDISWELEDSSFGSVENGVFTSNGKIGDAVVQMIYNDKVVGTTTIHVVVPDSLKFNSSVISVPYGKSVKLEMTAKYGVREVALKSSDVKFELSDDKLGEIDGFDFIANDGSAGIAMGEVTASLKADDSVTASATINFGQASEVLVDYEQYNDAEEIGYSIKTGYAKYAPSTEAENGQGEVGSVQIVTEKNGKVRNGNQALAVTCDFTQIMETGYQLLNLSIPELANMSSIENAKSLGFWMYVPEEIEGVWMRFSGSADGTTITPTIIATGMGSTYEEPGWHYFTVDLSNYSTVTSLRTVQIYVSDRDGASYGYYFKNYSSVNSKFTFYIDDITIDYSTVVEDRELPIIDNVLLFDENGEGNSELKGQTISYNKITVSADVEDDTKKDNYSGLDYSTAKAYVDGVAVTDGFSYNTNGKLILSDVTLADGVHTIGFEISDKMGNSTIIHRQVNIAAGSDLANVSLVPQNPEADKLPIGSLYWVNLEASDIEKVQTVTTKLNLNSVSQWQLDYMNVAEGFTADYVIDEANNDATITITRTGDSNVTGKASLVEIPIRTWESTITENKGYEMCTPEWLWSNKRLWPMDIKLAVEYGAIEFIDGTTGSFSAEKIAVDTELYGNYAVLNADGVYASKTRWHLHTEEPIIDESVTCTNGYRERTFCEECNSIVNWGITGHRWQLVEGMITCDSCDQLYNGEYEGKHYTDGIGTNGWLDEYYYVNGNKVTGIYLIDNCYYNFDENGVNKGKYTGLFTDEEGIRYALAGVLQSGWQYVDDKYYYIDSKTLTAVTGKYKYYSFWEYTFDDNGVLVTGAFYRDANGNLMYHYAGKYVYNRWMDVNGDTYYFDKNGFALTGNVLKTLNTGGADYYAYAFDENGVYQGLIKNSFFMIGDKKYYANEEGIAQKGLICVDGNYYYASKNTYELRTGKYYVEVSAGNGYITESAYYHFGNDGKMLDKEFYTEGTSVFYIEKGQIVKGPAIVTVDGDRYYLQSNGALLSNTSISVPAELMGTETNVTCYFNSDGKMYHNEFAVINSKMRFLVDGQIQKVGLFEFEGGYYYASTNTGEIKTGNYYVNVNSGNGYITESGYYYFGVDGKMLDKEFYNNGTSVFYVEKGQIVKGPAIVTVDGERYYVQSNGALLNNTSISVSAELMGTETNVTCYFDENGRMYHNEFATINGKLRFLVDGQIQKIGLFEFEGGYYYASTNTGEIKTGNYYVGVNAGNGYITESGYYYFNSDGRMLDKEFYNNGTTVFYVEMGQIVKGPAIVTVSGERYYIQSNGALLSNTSISVPAGLMGTETNVTCYVDENGRLYHNEFAIINDKERFLVDGQIQKVGLFEFEGDYYYASHNTGEIKTGSYYVAAKYANNLVSEGWYNFGDDGRMVR